MYLDNQLLQITRRDDMVPGERLVRVLVVNNNIHRGADDFRLPAARFDEAVVVLLVDIGVVGLEIFFLLFQFGRFGVVVEIKFHILQPDKSRDRFNLVDKAEHHHQLIERVAGFIVGGHVFLLDFIVFDLLQVELDFPAVLEDFFRADVVMIPLPSAAPASENKANNGQCRQQGRGVKKDILVSRIFVSGVSFHRAPPMIL